MNAHVRCINCGREFDLADLGPDQFRHPPTPNTLTDYPDVSQVDFQCPECGYWKRAGEPL